jgi:hypothetical protein
MACASGYRHPARLRASKDRETDSIYGPLDLIPEAFLREKGLSRTDTSGLKNEPSKNGGKQPGPLKHIAASVVVTA